MQKQAILDDVTAALQACDAVLSARVYGSWLHDERSVDLDIAVMVPSDAGVVPSRTYRDLRRLREELVARTGQDIDLVPHTEDECEGMVSPLRNPRYNPSLVHGTDLKGKVRVEPIPRSRERFGYAALAAYVLLDNRTITRRQLVRSMTPQEGRIYVSKLLHGPGNALTYRACNWHTDYLASPSDLSECIDVFDERFGVVTSPALEFFARCKRGLGFAEAEILMGWYERLIVVTLLPEEQGQEDYDAYCRQIGIDT
jgi:predicted nucleotidyltransferase